MNIDNTDERRKKRSGRGSSRIPAYYCLPFGGGSFFLSVFIYVHLWIHSRFRIRGNDKKIAASAPSQGVVLGWKRSAALHDGATGGMSADILLAHAIAAAKVRRQSL
jgi:hypothetical protein